MNIGFSRLFAPLALLATPLAAFAEKRLDFQDPVSPNATTMLELHHLILLICVIIAVVVFGVMAWSLIFHRKSRGVTPARFSHSTAVEVVWTAIPALILVAMAIPSTTALIEMEDTTEAEITVKITGYQWFWEYEVLGTDVRFFSRLSTPIEQVAGEAPKGENYLLEVDNDLVLPVGKKVRFLLTSNDVIHAWWVPALGVKKDAIPGTLNEMWTRIDVPGTYRGVCAELCGKDHGFMPVVVRGVSDAEYEQWLRQMGS
ncbi:cytochrome c oxidase subunit II [Gammaproteobacteria bacterium]|nr:cytochrome c oxidase subunit II [Gammaproteobacteria bacterium]